MAQEDGAGAWGEGQRRPLRGPRLRAAPMVTAAAETTAVARRRRAARGANNNGSHGEPLAARGANEGLLWCRYWGFVGEAGGQA